jgi:hypothetical protein
MRAEGRSWRSVAATLDVRVSTARGVLPNLPVFRLARQCRPVSGGLVPLNAVTERFRGGVKDLCPPRGGHIRGSGVSSTGWPRLYGSNSRGRRWFWPTAARYEWEGDFATVIRKLPVVRSEALQWR